MKTRKAMTKKRVGQARTSRMLFGGKDEQENRGRLSGQLKMGSLQRSF